MRFFIGLVLTLALGVMGCSEASSDKCAGIVCVDTGNECTEGVCNPETGMCDEQAVGEGGACSTGACLEGVCTALVTVSSVVTELDGMGNDRPAAGATVQVLGTSLSTTSDETGSFTFDVFEGEWFFQASKEGAWGHIERDRVRPTGDIDFQGELFSDEVMTGLAGLLDVEIDPAKGWVALNLGSPSGLGGETATLSEPYDHAFAEDAQGSLVLTNELLPGGGQDLEFLNVGVTDELVVTPEGVDGINECMLRFPGLVFPVKAKFRTKPGAWCTTVN